MYQFKLGLCMGCVKREYCVFICVDTAALARKSLFSLMGVYHPLIRLNIFLLYIFNIFILMGNLRKFCYNIFSRIYAQIWRKVSLYKLRKIYLFSRPVHNY